MSGWGSVSQQLLRQLKITLFFYRSTELCQKLGNKTGFGHKILSVTTSSPSSSSSPSSLNRFYAVSRNSYFFFICQAVVGGIYQYKLIPQSKTWHDAQEYCREAFDDLAVTKDNNSVNASVQQRDFPVWVGLHRDGKTRSHTRGGFCT